MKRTPLTRKTPLRAKSALVLTVLLAEDGCGIPKPAYASTPVAPVAP